MAYLIRQKFNISDLAAPVVVKNRVLIFSCDDYLSQLYASHLRIFSMDVSHCHEQDFLKDNLNRFSPRLLLADLDSLGSHYGWLYGLNLKRDFPSLLVVTVGRGLDAAELGELMLAGISSHINRSFSRPQDIATVVKSLLGNN